VPLDDAPSIIDLAGATEADERLLISGSVSGEDCATLLAGAIVEVWHANAEGEYGDFYGAMMTDNKGHYQLTTIKPGSYLIDEQTVASHLHFRVAHPEAQPVELEVMFEGDPDLGNNPDMIESLSISLTKEEQSGQP
jgi:protocatechuate 3,4-dioxygenase beta subunit